MVPDLIIKKFEFNEYQNYANYSYEVVKRIETFSEIEEF